MRLQYYLSRPHSETETAIFLRISHGGKSFKIYTGISVHPINWDEEKHAAKISRSFRQGGAINIRLDGIKSKIERAYFNYINDNDAEPTVAQLRKLADDLMGNTKDCKFTFQEYFQDFIERTKDGKRQTQKGKIINSYKHKSYKTTLHKIIEFKPNADWNDITLDFYHDFIGWLRQKRYAENNIGSHIKNLKSVLNEATENNQNTNLAFRSKRFITIQEDVENIALTTEELELLHKLNLSNSPHLERTRDLFLIGAHTGLRFSDFSRLSSDNIKGDFIEITQSKTGDSVAIPIHHVVKKMIEKYNGDLPPAISNQKFNAYIKDVCKMVPELCENISKSNIKGGMKVTIKLEKWQAISTHTARRSFATNAYLQGIPAITIMAITGHKTEKNFLKYIKVTRKEHAKIMATYWNRAEMKKAN